MTLCMSSRFYNAKFSVCTVAIQHAYIFIDGVLKLNV